MIRLSGATILGLLLATHTATAVGRERVVERTIHVKLASTGSDIAFDRQKIDVPMGKKIRLRYKNDAPIGSEIDHNVAIVKPGRVEALMETLQEHGYDLKVVAGSPDILAMTKTIKPGQEGTLDFSPPGPGEYVFICLMPGHGDMMGMRGVLKVK
jgi:uncharacterized cupredoxin-like copper-binding protein